jgi:hypothetical protein
VACGAVSMTLLRDIFCVLAHAVTDNTKASPAMYFTSFVFKTIMFIFYSLPTLEILFVMRIWSVIVLDFGVNRVD